MDVPSVFAPAVVDGTSYQNVNVTTSIVQSGNYEADVDTDDGLILYTGVCNVLLALQRTAASSTFIVQIALVPLQLLRHTCQMLLTSTKCYKRQLAKDNADMFVLCAGC